MLNNSIYMMVKNRQKYPRRIEVRKGVTLVEIVEEGAKKPTTFY